jgi:hypothetical protein
MQNFRRFIHKTDYYKNRSNNKWFISFNQLNTQSIDSKIDKSLESYDQNIGNYCFINN